MSPPVKASLKRAARFNLLVILACAVFSLWAIAKAQQDGDFPARHFPAAEVSITR